MTTQNIEQENIAKNTPLKIELKLFIQSPLSMGLVQFENLSFAAPQDLYNQE